MYRSAPNTAYNAQQHMPTQSKAFAFSPRSHASAVLQDLPTLRMSGQLRMYTVPSRFLALQIAGDTSAWLMDRGECDASYFTLTDRGQ